MIARYRKALAALFGALTPAVVVFVLGLVGVHVDPTVAAAICTVLATGLTILVPANAPKPAALRPTD